MIHSTGDLMTIATTFQMISRFLGAAALALALSACGSKVLLDNDVPVSDRAGVAIDSSASGADARAVAPVDTQSALLGQAPAGLATVVYFDFDDYSVRSEFMQVVEGHARFLNSDRQRRVVLEGHTDERGGREYNLALGQKRADAVRRALSVLGVSEAQMESVSYGKEKPASTGANEFAHSQNRRVELSYR
jgi:peptidoglycan-associated lipoprotein